MHFFLRQLCEKNHEKEIDIVHYMGSFGELLSLVVASVLLLCATLSAQGKPELSIPAVFQIDLNLPGEGNHFLRPARIFVDRAFHEVYVCDPGNARILIFNEHGVFQYEFSVTEHMGAPLDVVVTSDGYIIVLGSTRQGMQLMKFDFDGLYLGSFAADDANLKKLEGTSSIAIDDQNRVYALIHSRGQVVRCSRDGRVETEFLIEPNVEAGRESEMTYGSMYYSGGYLYVPVANYGAVNRLTPDGKVVGRIGIKGTLVGQLNFPISVSVSTGGIITVLDKHRFNVVCYDEKGRFLAEFGGKGTHAGWFYHPTWIAIDALNQVYVGQIFDNRVQVLSIPDLIYRRESELAGHAVHSNDSDSTVGLIIDNPEVTRRWSDNDDMYTFDCVEGDNLHVLTSSNRYPNNPLSHAFTQSVGGTLQCVKLL